MIDAFPGFGGPAGVPDFGTNTTAKRTYESDCPSCEIGSAVGLGDLNADGFADIVMSAPDDFTTQAFEGRVSIAFGKW